MTNQAEVPDYLREACRRARVPEELYESFLDGGSNLRLWRHRERDENMLAANRAGWSTEEIALELDVSVRTVQLGIRRAREAETTESPEERLAVLQNMLARAKESQPRATIANLRLALQAEQELNALLGPRPTPAYTTLKHGFAQFARQWRRAPATAGETAK